MDLGVTLGPAILILFLQKYLNFCRFVSLSLIVKKIVIWLWGRDELAVSLSKDLFKPKSFQTSSESVVSLVKGLRVTKGLYWVKRTIIKRLCWVKKVVVH